MTCECQILTNSLPICTQITNVRVDETNKRKTGQYDRIPESLRERQAEALHRLLYRFYLQLSVFFWPLFSRHPRSFLVKSHQAAIGDNHRRKKPQLVFRRLEKNRNSQLERWSSWLLIVWNLIGTPYQIFSSSRTMKKGITSTDRRSVGLSLMERARLQLY